MSAGSAQVTAQTQAEVDAARSEREAVRQDANQVADKIDALNDEADELASQLDILNVTISVVTSRLEAAEGMVASTEYELGLLTERITALEAQQSALQDALVAGLVDHYIGGIESRQSSILTADDPVGWSMQQGLVEFVSRDISSLQDQLRVVEADLTDAYMRSADLAAEAAAERDTVAELAQAADQALDTQAEVLGKVSQRLDRRLAEADALAAIDMQLSEEIRRGEEEIARRVSLAQAKARVDDSHEGGGSAKDNIARPEDIVNVRGIEIHQSISGNLEAMMAAAEADGIVLGGAGWRSTEYQIELRMQNCGTTDYLIFDAPSEACWPPTARPASSNHEAGKAVDLTAGGRAIVDQNSVAFQWLAANASTYGFYNLWSEPWHWSTDGR